MFAVDFDLPPDPSRLDVNWWDYFVAGQDDTPEAVEQRFETGAVRLSELKEQLAAEGLASQAALADTVLKDLSRYQQFKARPFPLPPVAKVAQDSYTVAEIRALIEELRKTGVQRSEEDQEIVQLENAISAGQNDLNEQKVRYRASAETSPDRMEEGLLLMQSRLQLELARLELLWRRTNSKSLGQQIDDLQALVEDAAKRLTTSEEDVAAAENARASALNTAKELRMKLLRVQLAQSGALALTPLEQARDRLASQSMIELDVQATRQELVASEYALIQRILIRIGQGKTPPGEADRSYLSTYIEELSKLEDSLAKWRRETARSRETAMAGMSDDNSKQLQTLLEQRARLSDSTERELRGLDEELIGGFQLGNLFDSLLAQGEGRVTRSVQFAEHLADLSWEKVLRLLSTSLFELGGAPVTTLDIFRMFIILTAAWWISKILSKTLVRIAAARNTVNDGSIYTLSRILHYIILAVGIMVALSSIGIDFTKFALFASALGVGIGFGLQTLVGNFVAGLIILFERSLKIGDFVELESGVTGEVREINMRSTLVTTNDNIDIVVPNSEFVNGQVTNWTMREVYRRVRIPFGVAYGTDKELVKKAALEAANNVPLTHQKNKSRKPQLWFVEFGDSSLNFELVVWLEPDAVKRPGHVHASYLWAIDDKLREYAIEVPFPQRDLHVRSVFGKTSAEDLPLMGGKPESLG
ncbi:mechanosensitive ion channel [Congregibacter variabilis]|uniref:Mechanosensitive ion channel n=1 Tax=Congregibacter variabilis TaxID=3081200 RepID=A0ABZ0I4Z4_9GAMM|nr:mechanosensitive ion channel [Congregibacter sp. IMCC43200]